MIAPGRCSRGAAAAATLLAGACAVAPSTLRPASAPARELSVLQWWLIIISLSVCLIIAVLILIPLRRRVRTVRDAPVTREGSTTGIIVGVVITGVIMTAVFVYSAVVLAHGATPPQRPAVAIEVTGHRWWWEVRYLSPDPRRAVTTANEIHIPVGEPVRIEGMTADVVHDFWVPRLQGKRDLNPGQTSTFWIEADTAGVYRGQCAEFCGVQHAHMIFYVIAQPPREFAAWLAHERQPAPTPRTPAEAAGQRAFITASCAACHTVRGTRAGGVLGPDLTHFASRRTLGAGTLSNTPGNVAGWITNAQTIKPGAGMPRLDLDPATIREILAYLDALR